MRRRYLLRLRPRPGSEAGMTILELVLAMTVMLGALLTIAHTGTAGLGVVTKSRQRQEAAALSSQTLERMRALPFDTLVAGLDNGDLANAVNPSHADYDPAVVDGGLPGVYRFQGEIIARGDRTAPVDPLYPHLDRDVDIGEPGGTVYDVASYVTHYNDVLFNGIYRLTVVVAWDDAAADDGRTEVMSQSLATSPAGCRSTTTHPFSGPCRPFFYGVAGFMGGQISIGPSGPSGPLVGVNVENGRIDLPSFSTSVAVEQTQTVSGVVTMSGGTMTYSDGTPEGRVGFSTARTQATNDITKPGVGTSSTQSVPATGASTLQGPAVSATYLQSALESGDQGSSVSTVGATGPDACYDESSPRLVLATLAPCGNASAVQGGAARIRMALDDPVLDLSARRYARVSGATGYAGSYRDTPDSSTTCPVVAGSDRCVRSFAHRELGDVRLMRLPSEITGPTGFSDYLVRLQGFKDDVRAAAGDGLAPAPTATLTSGTITYWNGAGYSTMAASATPGTPIPAAAMDFTEVDAGTGTLIRVRMTPSLTTGGTAVDASACAEPTEHCVEARSFSPILGTITFQIDYDGVTKVSWRMSVDLGTIVATATYKEPPSVL